MAAGFPQSKCPRGQTFSDQASGVTWQYFHCALLEEVVMNSQTQGERILASPLNGRSVKTCATFFLKPPTRCDQALC